MADRQHKNFRTLDLYARLCEGKVISKVEEARRFGVDERSIQRDIDDIRSFLDERQITNSTDTRSVVYDRRKKGFVMTGQEVSMMTNSEILAVSKILLDSRAFTRKEIGVILDKLVKGCVPLRNMRMVCELIENEKYHYVELQHKSSVQDKLWELGTDVKEHNLLEIQYQRADRAKKDVKRVIEPVAILFSEYYFYLNAYIVEKGKHGRYIHQFEYPAIFRIDRIKKYQKIGEKFSVPYHSRFEEGEFRKRVQFMYAGELMKLRIRFTGESPEAVLDRLPTAEIVSEKEKEWIIEAEVYGDGIVMWLLSQGTKVEVLKPDALREEMKQTLREMLEKY